MSVANAFPAVPEHTAFEASERSALLNRVLNSQELRRSARLREFLQYVGDRAMSGTTHVSEQEIGIAVFGRQPSYETAIDNIVRVNATHLRKRIEIYFATEGADEPLILNLPRGSYIPVFELRSVDSSLEPAAAIEVAPATSADDFVSMAAPQDHRRGWIYGLGATAVVLACLCIALLVQNHGLRAGVLASSSSKTSFFWTSFFGNGKPVDLVLSDTSFALVQDMLKQPVSLKDYANKSYVNHIDSMPGDAQLRQDLKLVAERNNGSFGEFRFAEEAMRLAPAAAHVRFESAREFSASDLNSNNLVLVGSRRSNPWVELFDDRLNFNLHSDISTNAIVVDNRHPRSGEPAQYSLPADPTDYAGFCIIASLRNVNNGNNVLLIKGTGSEETQAAGNFLVSLQDPETRRKLFGTTELPAFEVLLRTRKLYGAPLNYEVLNARAL